LSTSVVVKGHSNFAGLAVISYPGKAEIDGWNW